MDCWRSAVTVLLCRHFTSKCSSIEEFESGSRTYGHCGESLSAVVNVSGVLAITSKCSSDSRTCTRLFWRGKPCHVEEAAEKRARGTTVTITDFFYNLPVRRKSVKGNVEMEGLRSVLERIAVVHPHVSFSLKDESTGESVLSIVRCKAFEQTFLRLFGEDAARRLSKLKSKQGKLRFEGFVRLEAFHDGSLRLLYVNKVLLRDSRLNKYVDTLILKHIFASASARFPVYVLNVRCPHSFYQLTREPLKTVVEFFNWEDVFAVIEDGIARVFKRESEPNDSGPSAVDLQKDQQTVRPGMIPGNEAKVTTSTESRLNHGHLQPGVDSRKEASEFVPSE